MKAVFTISVLLFVAWSVQAQPMGASLEAGFAGPWRIIEACAAPWVEPHALTKEEASFLELAVSFREGEVAGPSPIDCGRAKYASTMVPPRGLFQGALPTRKEEEIAKTLGLDSDRIPTLRVACDTGSFDYHLDGSGRLRFALNNVAYTMKRP